MFSSGDTKREVQQGVGWGHGMLQGIFPVFVTRILNFRPHYPAPSITSSGITEGVLQKIRLRDPTLGLETRVCLYLVRFVSLRKVSSNRPHPPRSDLCRGGFSNVKIFAADVTNIYFLMYSGAQQLMKDSSVDYNLEAFVDYRVSDKIHGTHLLQE